MTKSKEDERWIVNSSQDSADLDSPKFAYTLKIDSQLPPSGFLHSVVMIILVA
ncbi:6636_t:CDS:1, partial [Racocetra persica]